MSTRKEPGISAVKMSPIQPRVEVTFHRCFALCTPVAITIEQRVSGCSITPLTFVLIIAIPAVHRSVCPWLEGYLGLFATTSTNSRIHLARSSTCNSSLRITFCLSFLTARQATLGRISKAFRGIERLLLRAEGKGFATINTLKGLLLIRHRNPPPKSVSSAGYPGGKI